MGIFNALKEEGIKRIEERKNIRISKLLDERNATFDAAIKEFDKKQEIVNQSTNLEIENFNDDFSDFVFEKMEDIIKQLKFIVQGKTETSWSVIRIKAPAIYPNGIMSADSKAYYQVFQDEFVVFCKKSEITSLEEIVIENIRLALEFNKNTKFDDFLEEDIPKNVDFLKSEKILKMIEIENLAVAKIPEEDEKFGDFLDTLIEELKIEEPAEKVITDMYTDYKQSSEKKVKKISRKK